MRTDLASLFIVAAINSCHAQAMVPSSAPASPSTIPQGSGAMWSGIDARIPQNWNFSDRFFAGNAANNVPSNRSQTTSTWLPNTTAGAEWIIRDSQVTSMSTAGGTALSGLSRASDGDSIASPPAPIGVAGYALNDSISDHGAWAFYGEVQHQPTIGTNQSVFGMELDCKNKTIINALTDPYSMKQGCYGIALGAGGDASYGGASLNPSNTAIFINNNSNTWRAGIVFSSTSLTDYHAINMALQHRITWYSATTVEAVQMMAGAGSPAGIVSCSGRCLYIRTDGGAGSTLYVNETGGGTSGWAAK